MRVTATRTETERTLPMAAKGRGIGWTSDLKQLLDRRLAKLERRSSGRFRPVGVSLEDVNGPRGGVDKRCRLRFVLQNDGPLAVSAESATPEAAITQAVNRASNMVHKLSPNQRRRVNASNCETMAT